MGFFGNGIGDEGEDEDGCTKKIGTFWLDGVDTGREKRGRGVVGRMKSEDTIYLEGLTSSDS